MGGKWSQNSPIRTYVLCELIMRMRLMDGVDALYLHGSLLSSLTVSTLLRVHFLCISVFLEAIGES